MKISLEGKTALVTGASRGIGLGIAAALSRAGAAVIGTSTSEQGAESLQELLQKQGHEIIPVVLDVASAESVAKIGAFMEARALAPQILVNNAGIARDNLLIRMPDDEWDEVINTNLTSMYRMTKLCLRGMMKARYGRIINLTSVIAMSGNAGQVNYAAAKAGVIGFTRSLAKEVGSRNITVNAVAPGFISTDMTAQLPAPRKEEMLRQISLGRLGSVEEIADVVAFLASASAAYITGETINVNGGMYMA